MRLGYALALALAFGCGKRLPQSLEAQLGTSAAAAAPDRSDEVLTAPSTGMAALLSAPVVVTGVLMRRGPDVEICPGDSVRTCPGVAVDGKVEDAWLSHPHPSKASI